MLHLKNEPSSLLKSVFSDVFKEKEMKVNLELSENYSGIKRIGECYTNSFHALDSFPTGKYVEGYALGNDPSFGLTLIQHGWIELNNEIIDVTCLGKMIKYFPCEKYTKEEAFEEWQKLKLRLPIFHHKFIKKGKALPDIWYKVIEEAAIKKRKIEMSESKKPKSKKTESQLKKEALKKLVKTLKGLEKPKKKDNLIDFQKEKSARDFSKSIETGELYKELRPKKSK